MKIKYLFFIFLLSGALTYSQDKTQNLGDFSEIKVFNGLSVKIERSEKSEIQISGSKTDEVVFKNVNGKLKLSLKFPETFNADKVKIKIFYTNDLHTLDANEGSAIISKELIKQDNITIKAQEGAYIHVPVEAKYVTIKAVSGGAIKVRGTVVNQDVEVTTGGIYEAYELQSEFADATAASGGRAEVNVTKLLDAKVRFGGNVYYKGKPERINKKRVIGGTILNKG